MSPKSLYLFVLSLIEYTCVTLIFLNMKINLYDF